MVAGSGQFYGATESQKKGIELAQQVSHILNAYDREAVEAFVAALANDHRTLQQNAMRYVIMPFLRLKALDYGEGRYDARNQQTCQVAAEMLKAVVDKDHFPFI